ncbi:MAG: prepilin-type N-terminal cleavage/methylation domain-containing protein [Lachnospiraceae bacterium]|nr:prepilin-type N-terminal cleavage/methylation domain-containing protein [Lachnospiraceae bacterium]
MNKKKGKKMHNRGVTMVELIITFALLAVFLTTATMCISHAVIFYYHERQTMSAYSVADMVLSEIKDDIRTMQSSDYNGYIKIREKNAVGNLIAVSPAAGEYKGSTLEYVASNLNDGANVVQIDTNGCNCAMIDDKSIKKSEIDDIDKDYLTMRYYGRYPEKNLNQYKNLYMDRIITGSSADVSGNYAALSTDKVVWHAQEKLAKQVYQDYTISLEFSVKPGAANAEGKQYVDYVDVTVKVNNTEGEVYKKTRRVNILNKVYYENGRTLYSDVY